MDNKNVIYNRTLEEYNRKYRNRRFRLLKITKKELEEFDKKNPTNVKKYLLKDRKWWLIGDTYYEVPKAPRKTWFRNLSAGAQAATCILSVGVLTAAVTVPLVMLNKKSDEGGNTPEPQPTPELPEYLDIIEIPGTNNCQIQGSNKSEAPKDIDIPEKIQKNGKTYTVTEIAVSGFNYDRQGQKITGTVTLPSTITTIHNSAFFQGCNVSKIVLNNGLLEIEDSAFDSSLIEINIPSSVTKIESMTFDSCSNKNFHAFVDNQSFVNSTSHEGNGSLFNKAQTLYINKNLTIPTTCYLKTKYIEGKVSKTYPDYIEWTKKTTWTCNACGCTNNPDSEKFCTQCGSPRP